MRLAQVILAGFLIRFFVAIWNGFIGPTFGAELDALGFHEAATQVGTNLDFIDFKIGAVPYANFLGLVYYTTASSLFVGSLLSCLIWVLSAKILVRIMRLLSFEKKYSVRAMLIYSFLPTSIFMTSVTLREVYQLLFVNLAVYAVLKIYLHKSAVHWLMLIAAVVGMGLLHGGLFASGLFVIIAAMTLLTLRGRQGFSLGKIVAIAPFVLIAAVYGLSLFASFSYNLEDGVGAAVESYQQGGLNTIARTNYKTDVAIDGPIGLLLFMPVSLFQYLFEPMPWRISALSDIVLVAENAVRVWLVWSAWVGLKQSSGVGRRLGIFLLATFFVLELIWSLGTVNWGTAARHHIPSIGILVVAAFLFSRESNIRPRSDTARRLVK